MNGIVSAGDGIALRPAAEPSGLEQWLGDMAVAFAGCSVASIDDTLAHWLRQLTAALYLESALVAELDKFFGRLYTVQACRTDEAARRGLLSIAEARWVADVIREREVRILTGGAFPMAHAARLLASPDQDPAAAGAYQALALIPLWVEDDELGLLVLGSADSGEALEDFRHGFRLIGAIVSTAVHRKRMERTLAREVRRKKEAIVDATMEQVRHREILAHICRVHAVEKMATGIAHELNQPLAAMNNYAEAGLAWLEQGGDSLDKLPALLRKIIDQSLRAGRMLESLKKLVKKEETLARPCDINDIVREACVLAEADARASDCALETHLAPGLPAVRVDPVQIQQILLNLIRNAVEDMAGIGCRSPLVRVRTARDANSVVVSVSDRGKGIGEHERLKIFKPFYSTKAKGMGLGLAICQQIVLAHGGHIGYRNNPEGGATFHFSLPAASTG